MSVIVPTLPSLHFVFDALACLAALTAAAWQRMALRLSDNRHLDSGYLSILLLGAAVGGYGLGTLNLAASGIHALAHSVLGALAGGILAVELYKPFRGIRESTGMAFALPFCAGVAVGRIGCFLAGMSDMTYGTPTELPWRVDFGDGVPRHPVQLYESLSMIVAGLIMVFWIRRAPQSYRIFAFPAVVCLYAAQRFLWEFLKPYAALVFGMNLFQCICLLLLAYGLTQIFTRYFYGR